MFSFTHETLISSLNDFTFSNKKHKFRGYSMNKNPTSMSEQNVGKQQRMSTMQTSMTQKQEKQIFIAYWFQTYSFCLWSLNR